MMKIRNLLTAGVAALAIGTAVPALAEGQIAVGMQTQVDQNGHIRYVDRAHNNRVIVRTNRTQTFVSGRRYNAYNGYQPTYNTWQTRSSVAYPYSYQYRDRDRHHWRDHDHLRFGQALSMILSIPYGSYAAYEGGCGPGGVRMVMNDFNGGGPVVVQRNYGSGFYFGEPLTGYRISPASSTCIPTRDVRLNRVSLIHDVNNNGIFDPQDGIGRISLGYASGLGWGGSRVIRVNFDYGFDRYNYGY